MGRVDRLATATLSVAALRGAAAWAADEPDISGVWQAYASTPPSGPGRAAALIEEGRRRAEAYFEQLVNNYVEPGAYSMPPDMSSTMTSM